MSPIIIDQTQLAQLLQSLGYAILAAVVYSLLGYFKRKDPAENFDGVQLFTTLAIGIIAGLVAYFLDLTSTQALALVLGEAGLTSYIEDFVKAIWRRWIQPWLTSQTPSKAPS